MKRVKSIKHDPTTECPDIDPFEHLVERVNVSQDNEVADDTSSLEVDSEPESQPLQIGL